VVNETFRQQRAPLGVGALVLRAERPEGLAHLTELLQRLAKPFLVLDHSFTLKSPFRRPGRFSGGRTPISLRSRAGEHQSR